MKVSLQQILQGLMKTKYYWSGGIKMKLRSVSRIQNSYHFESLDKTEESTDLAQYL